MGDVEGPHLEIRMVSQPRYLAGTRSLVAAVCRRFGFPETTCGQIALAMDEALCNVINHGYERRPDGPIWIRLWPLGEPPEGIRIVIEDEGRQVDPETIRSRPLDEIRPGGLGVFIINEIMDHAQYHRRDERGMCLVMEKRIEDEEASGDAGTGEGPDAARDHVADCRGGGSHAARA